MNKFIISLALASTVAIAAPAAAQYQRDDGDQDSGYDRGDRNYGFQQGRQLDQQIYQLRERIMRVSRRGAVSRQESIRLQRQLDQIERRHDEYSRNGINRDEQYNLQRRIQNLRAQVREDRQDGRRHQTLERGYQDDGRYDRGREYDDRRYDRRNRDDDD